MYSKVNISANTEYDCFRGFEDSDLEAERRKIHDMYQLTSNPEHLIDDIENNLMTEKTIDDTVGTDVLNDNQRSIHATISNIALDESPTVTKENMHLSYEEPEYGIEDDFFDKAFRIPGTVKNILKPKQNRQRPPAVATSEKTKAGGKICKTQKTQNFTKRDKLSKKSICNNSILFS
ncbi:uncharacterized protein LOC134218777 [Armigeres subalbatus]|uniref:uncharacterized protein LOC134218777 n=1 Tax=Armigeres subalbatus TaxID=124917 RepID=UPI002ED076EF